MAKSSIQELVSAVAEKYGLSQKDAETFITVAFNVINDGLRDDKAVKVKGLGTFKVIDVRDRESVNVNTGERVLIEGHGKITFTPDPIMRDFVNKPFSQFDTVIINEGVDIRDFDGVTGESLDSDTESTDEEKQENIGDEDKKVSEESEHIASESDGVNPIENTDARKVSQDDSETLQKSGATEITGTDEIEGKAENNFPDNGVGNNADECAAPHLSDEMELSVNDTENQGKDLLVSNVGNVSEDEPPVRGTDSDAESPRTESDEFETSSNPNHRNHFFIIFSFIMCAVCLAAGYYWGRYITSPDVVVKYVKVHTPTPVPVDTISSEAFKEKEDSSVVVKSDSLNHGKSSDISVEKQSVKETAANKENSGTIKDHYVSQSLKNARAIVSSGAYRIIGTDRVVTVKKGETLEKISKFYLGAGMECYIQVYNNTDAVKEGMSLKIPKLQNKRNK